MQLKLLLFTELTSIQIDQEQIIFTSTDDTVTSYLAIPCNILLLINIHANKTYTYKGLNLLNKALQPAKTVKFEFDDCGTLNMKVMSEVEGEKDQMELIEFFFYSMVSEE